MNTQCPQYHRMTEFKTLAGCGGGRCLWNDCLYVPGTPVTKKFKKRTFKKFRKLVEERLLNEA